MRDRLLSLLLRHAGDSLVVPKSGPTSVSPSFSIRLARYLTGGISGTGGGPDTSTTPIPTEELNSVPEPYEAPISNDKAHILHKRGVDVLHDPIFNKGTAFTHDERERLSIRGLLPPKVSMIEQQVSKVLHDYQHGIDRRVPLDGSVSADQCRKWMYLAALQDRNETLFYRLLIDHFVEMSPIIYTPTVGWAALNYSAIYRRPRGLYITARDKGQMNSIIYNWPHDEVDAIVVTDGSRILGLGDLGINGLAIPVGKLDLYVAAAGFHPSRVLPVVIDVGTDNVALREEPTYVGLRQPRLQGNAYVEIIDEFVKAVMGRWPKAVLQFEDFKTDRAYYLLERYRHAHRVFNDDIQGTAATALAGLYGALSAGHGQPPASLAQQRIVVAGCGSAGLGVVSMIHQAMTKQGLSEAEAYRRFYMLDKDGLVTLRRRNVLDLKLRPFARSAPEELSMDGMSLEQVVRAVKPSILIGLTGAGRVFTEGVVKGMAEGTPLPIIFPMSNPTSRMEAVAEDVMKWTNGNVIFASGSPQKNVTIDGVERISNQANNLYIFPGLALAAFLGQVTEVTDAMLMAAAEALPGLVPRDLAARGAVYPPLQDIRHISTVIALRVLLQAKEEGVLTSRRVVEVLEMPYVEQIKWVQRRMYTPRYSNLVSLPPGVGQ